MGVVYEAFDRELDSRIALKCLPSTSPQAFFRFKREFRSLLDLNHENLVKFGELVYEAGQLFFTMELIDGTDIISHCWHQEGRAPDARTVSLTTRVDHVTLDAQVASGGFLYPNRGGLVTIDEARIRESFAQLVRGLMALHATDKVHRDVKPSNVLVTRAGRVVLLDFGVVAESVSSLTAAEARLVGTVAYMAPEQAALGKVGREADFYSVGAMLFEALTQHLPFEGSAAEILAQKQLERPPRARQLSANVSASLDMLCARLLDPIPKRRPSGEEILRFLESKAGAAHSVPRAPLSFFIGRDRELETLSRALAEAARGRVSVVHIEGESGSGKTTLVRHFLERASADAGTLVLSGRCSEREYVPYKALDGVVDDLAEFAARSASKQAIATLDRCLPELVRAFPAFGRVRPDYGEPPASATAADPYVQRLLLFRALRELLASVCAEKTLIVSLDDIQWADADSLALLSPLLHQPTALPFLLIVAGRPHGSRREQRRAWGGDLIELRNLSMDESATLASHLLEQSGCKPGQAADLAERIAREADGHPLFIDELVQQAAAGAGRIAPSVALDAALWSRVERLKPRARVLVELAAIAGSSVSLRVLAKAALGATAEDAALLSELLSLRNEHLLRFDGTGASNRVEVYHDRVAAAVRAQLSEKEQRGLHRAIAAAIESGPDNDPAELAVHWLGAGANDSAARYALMAAELAADALAFERAARLYQMALDCRPNHGDTHLIQERLGDALANAGLGAAAARAYLAASDGPDELRRFDLERRAADQLFRAGHIDDAEPLIQRVLRRMGMSIPRSPFWILVVLLVSRIRLLFTRLDGPLRQEPPSPRELVMLNACWSVAVGLSMVSNIRGACLQTRHLVLALRVGQPLPLLKALAAEAPYVAVTGQRARPRVSRLIRRVDALVERLDDPYAAGFASLSKAMCSFLMGDWGQSRGFAQSAERVFETRPAGAMWELASARTFDLWSSFYLGEVSAMRDRIGDFIQEAESRGDRYAATLHRTGLVVLAWLASDDAHLARQRVQEAETGWSRTAFDFQRYLITLGHCLIDLYEGAPELAYRRTTEMWPGLVRSLYLRIQNVRFEALYLRGLSAIGAAATAPNREPFLRDAERCASRIARERVGWSTALATMLTAGIADARGQRAAALIAWQRAADLAALHNMQLFAKAAAFRRGVALGGDGGLRVIEDVQATLAGQHIREPDRVCALLAPGRPVAGNQAGRFDVSLRGRGMS